MVGFIANSAANHAEGTRIFLSHADMNPNPAAVSVQNLALGAAASTYVWVIPDENEIMNGISLSLEASTPGVVETAMYRIFNPASSGGRKRWDGVTVQNLDDVDPPAPVGTPLGVINDGALLFRDWSSAALIPDLPIPGFTPSLGLNLVNGPDDTLWDAATGAFLYGRLTFTAIGAGTTDLFLKVGRELITVHGQGTEMIQFGAGASFTNGGVVGATDGEADAMISVVQLAGDTNADGEVDLVDLNNVRNNFGGAGLGDTDGNGVVDLSDLNNVRNNFGAMAGAAGLAAVPEPSALALVSLVCVAFGLAHLHKRLTLYRIEGIHGTGRSSVTEGETC